jgi:7,8-dihydropterin-6-yl-methyl-4-(beta-D-ribofuranosyl)aminobenzene 5'-phosphate synthase
LVLGRNSDAALGRLPEKDLRMAREDDPLKYSLDLLPVDRLEVQVLVDNVTDSLSTNPGGVRSELASLLSAGMAVWSGESICCAHHGLSLIVTAHANGTSHTVLFDSGPEGYVVERNGQRLGVAFDAIETVVLSHGHWDHGGGLLKALELICKNQTDREVPLYLHPDVFRSRGFRLPSGAIVPFKDVPRIEALTEQGGSVICIAEPRFLLGGWFYISGEIPRVTTYEHGFPNHMRKAKDGVTWEPDPLIMDERFLAVRVREKGLIVFTACSHAGVVNVLKNAQATFPAIPLYAVMGGLHLSGAGPEKIIPETVRDLQGFDLKMIIPGHCTGWRAITALVNTFGADVVVPSAVGKQYLL